MVCNEDFAESYVRVIWDVDGCGEEIVDGRVVAETGEG